MIIEKLLRNKRIFNFFGNVIMKETLKETIFEFSLSLNIENSKISFHICGGRENGKANYGRISLRKQSYWRN